MPKQKTDKADLFLYHWRIIASEQQEPIEEHNFDALWGRKHRFDFAFPESLVAVEIEGNAWNVKGGGKHMQERDLEKYNIAAAMGWRVLRFSPSMLKKDPYECINIVVEALEWSSTKKYSDNGAASFANVAVVVKDTTRITLSSTTSKRKAGRNIKNSTTPAISS